MRVCEHELNNYEKKNRHLRRNTHAIIPSQLFEIISNDRV